jgi:hypothetical protein
MSNLKYYNEETDEWEYLVIGKQGPTGKDGIVTSDTPPEDTSILWLDTSDTEDQLVIPAGGTTGQVLTKASNTDYDTEWSNDLQTQLDAKIDVSKEVFHPFMMGI